MLTTLTCVDSLPPARTGLVGVLRETTMGQDDKATTSSSPSRGTGPLRRQGASAPVLLYAGYAGRERRVEGV